MYGKILITELFPWYKQFFEYLETHVERKELFKVVDTLAEYFHRKNIWITTTPFKFSTWNSVRKDLACWFFKSPVDFNLTEDLLMKGLSAIGYHGTSSVTLFQWACSQGNPNIVTPFIDNVRTKNLDLATGFPLHKAF